MPIPSPGTYDQASQATLLAVKAKTDIIGASVALEAGGIITAVKAKTDNTNAGYVYMQILARRGNAVQGTWAWAGDAACTEWLSDRKLDSAGAWANNATGAINDEYAYPIILIPGAYSFELVYMKQSNCGILTLRLADSDLGTIDTYAAATSYNNITVLNFTVAADTVANLRMVMATKNAAASSYRLFSQRATLWRRT